MTTKNQETSSPEWQAVRRARIAVLTATMEAEKYAKKYIADMVSASDAALTRAMIAAHEAGLSKSAIGRAFGRKDFLTIQNRLNGDGA